MDPRKGIIVATPKTMEKTLSAAMADILRKWV
jgi:hypothetical protein